MEMRRETPTTELLVIGAGLPRTGTHALMTALEIILPGKCLHGFKVSLHEKEWCDIIRGKMSDKDFKNFFLKNNYVAAVDIPFYLVYDRALKVFPNAKVVLTVRDPASWEKSIKDTLLSLFKYSPLPLFFPFFPRYLSWFVDGDISDILKAWPLMMGVTIFLYNKRFQEMRAHIRARDGVKYFHKWVEQVESTVPENKLLKFNVKDGWGPLCEHIGVPIPNVPFPKSNSKGEFTRSLNKNKRRAWLLLYEFISIPLWVYWVYQLSR